MPAPPLQEWQPFFTVIGAAAATLIGAMFVVVSIGIGILSRDRSAAIRAFLSATVVHLSTVLFGSAFILVPGLDWTWLGAIAGLGGIAGLAYSVRVAISFRQHTGTDRSDWFWYVMVPPVGYVGLLAGGVAALRAAPFSLELFAAALTLLVVAGIRNGWDMIVFLVTRDRSST